MSFDVTATPGVSSVSWDMGDATTSTQQSFSHKYSTAGKKNVKVTVNLTGGGTCVATKQVTVYELPKFNIKQKAGNNYCLYQNNICLVDSSTGGDSGVAIKKRIIIWDDGAQSLTNYPSIGDVMCHHYSNPGTFKITIELTNDKDCKSEINISVTILTDIVPKISFYTADNDVEKLCDTAKAEFYDDFRGDTSTIDKRIYDWGDGSSKVTTKSRHLSHFYSKAGFYKVSLSYIQKNGCITTKDTIIQIETFDVKFDITKNAKKQCVGNVFRFTQKDPYSGAYYIWYMDNITQDYDFDLKYTDLNPNIGKHLISLEISNHGCTKKFKYDTIEVIGAVSQAYAYNGSQFNNMDSVYFQVKTKRYGVGKLSYFWDFDDDKAPQCTTSRVKGINVNNNCNYSTDSLGVHKYVNGVKRTWKLTVTDSLTGCVSETFTGDIDIGAGIDSAGIELVTNRKCLGNKEGYTVIFSNKLSPLVRIQVNLDSACDKDRWSVRFINAYEYTKTCDPSGWVTVGFAYTYGSPKVYTGFDSSNYYIDSSRLVRDTVWKHNWFKLEKDPIAGFALKAKCLHQVISPIIPDSVQKNISFSIWSWGDNTKEDTLYIANGDTLITPPNHIYQNPGSYKIKYYLENGYKCYDTAIRNIQIGFHLSMAFDTVICPGSEVMLKDSMSYNNSKNYWHMADRKLQGKEVFKWDFDDGRGFATDTANPVITFPKIGFYKIRLAAKDSANCWDTLTNLVNVGGVHAGIKNIYKRIICDGIVQLYDSSYSDYKPPTDSITKYYWEFGDGGNPSYLQNPFHYYSTFGNYTIFQRVENSRGCTDTAYINIVIEGPVTGFNIISDTVGCAPIKAVFKNTSIKTKDYIWYFGDPLKTKLSTNRDTNVSFTYTQPGTYYIYLFGSDSVKNPNAGNAIYYCKSFFPDTSTANHPVRKIVVLPAPKADFNVNFIQCKNKPITVTANSDSLYTLNRWKISGIDSIETPNKTGTLFLKDTGTFAIKYKPWYPPKAPYNVSCADSVTKLVKVTEIKAAFDLLKDTVGCPVFTFTNKTQNHQTITWNLGDSAAGDEKNIRHENQVTYKYISRKGTFNPCLYAENSDGCRDTICTTVNVDFVVKLKIPNVFTPGNNDNLNDAFDIEAEGMEEYHLVIYNRWGQKLFETDKDGIGDDGYNWRGRPNVVSDLYPDGTYFYILNYKFKCEDKAKEAHGTITLIGSEK